MHMGIVRVGLLNQHAPEGKDEHDDTTRKRYDDPKYFNQDGRVFP